MTPAVRSDQTQLRSRAVVWLGPTNDAVTRHHAIAVWASRTRGLAVPLASPGALATVEVAAQAGSASENDQDLCITSAIGMQGRPSVLESG